MQMAIQSRSYFSRNMQHAVLNVLLKINNFILYILSLHLASLNSPNAGCLGSCDLLEYASHVFILLPSLEIALFFLNQDALDARRTRCVWFCRRGVGLSCSVQGAALRRLLLHHFRLDRVEVLMLYSRAPEHDCLRDMAHASSPLTVTRLSRKPKNTTARKSSTGSF